MKVEIESVLYASFNVLFRTLMNVAITIFSPTAVTDDDDDTCIIVYTKLYIRRVLVLIIIDEIHIERTVPFLRFIF